MKALFAAILSLFLASSSAGQVIVLDDFSAGNPALAAVGWETVSSSESGLGGVLGGVRDSTLTIGGGRASLFVSSGQLQIGGDEYVQNFVSTTLGYDGGNGLNLNLGPGSSVVLDLVHFGSQGNQPLNMRVSYWQHLGEPNEMLGGSIILNNIPDNTANAQLRFELPPLALGDVDRITIEASAPPWSTTQLDNVTIHIVPEPTVWTAMVLGGVVGGLLLWRRRRSAGTQDPPEPLFD